MKSSQLFNAITPKWRCQLNACVWALQPRGDFGSLPTTSSLRDCHYNKYWYPPDSEVESILIHRCRSSQYHWWSIGSSSKYISWITCLHIICAIIIYPYKVRDRPVSPTIWFYFLNEIHITLNRGKFQNVLLTTDVIDEVFF